MCRDLSIFYKVYISLSCPKSHFKQSLCLHYKFETKNLNIPTFLHCELLSHLCWKKKKIEFCPVLCWSDLCSPKSETRPSVKLTMMISIVWCPHLISSPAPTPIKIICSHNEEWDYLINLINGMDYGWVGTFTIRSASLPCYYYYQLLTISILHIFMQIYCHTHIISSCHTTASYHASCQIILPISDMGWPSTELWTAGMMDDGFMCCLPCQLYK